MPARFVCVDSSKHWRSADAFTADMRTQMLSSHLLVLAHSRKLTAYRGNYDTFEKTAAERMRNQRKAAESVALKKQHMQVRSVTACICICCVSGI